jgi:AraC-like DNA-binding protein
MLLYLTLSTIVIALFILANNYNRNKHAICLSAFLCIVSLYGLTHYFVLFGKSAFWLAFFYNHFTPLYLLLGPSLLFYVRGVLFDSECISKKDLLHGIPALIQLLGILPYIVTPFTTKLDYAHQIQTNFDSIVNLNLNQFYDADISFLIRVSLFLIYILYSIYLLARQLPTINQQKQVPQKQFLLLMRWMWILVSCSLIITLYLLSLTLLAIFGTPKEAFNSSYLFHIISGVTYFIMTVTLLLMPEILYGLPRVQKNDSLIPQKVANKIDQLIDHKIEKDNPLYVLSVKIIELMETEKPYLDTDFSIASLAIHLKVPQHHISYCINSILKTSFYKLRGKYRVDHAIYLLNNDIQMKLTMEAIGSQSGFTTRSNFYKTFKEFTGKTPLEYTITKNYKTNLSR